MSILMFYLSLIGFNNLFKYKSKINYLLRFCIVPHFRNEHINQSIHAFWKNSSFLEVTPLCPNITFRLEMQVVSGVDLLDQIQFIVSKIQRFDFRWIFRSINNMNTLCMFLFDHIDFGLWFLLDRQLFLSFILNIRRQNNHSIWSRFLLDYQKRTNIFRNFLASSPLAFLIKNKTIFREFVTLFWNSYKTIDLKHNNPKQFKRFVVVELNVFGSNNDRRNNIKFKILLAILLKPPFD